MTFITCSPDEITCTVADDGRSITFHPCGWTSHHPKDIEEQYCGRCHRWIALLLVAREMQEKWR